MQKKGLLLILGIILLVFLVLAVTPADRVVQRDNLVVLQHALINGSNGGTLGDSVLVIADLNNDSYNDFITGAPSKTVNGVAFTGQIYIFYGSSDGLRNYDTTQANVTINGSAQGYLGIPIVAEDFNNDSCLDLFTSSYLANLSGGTYDNTGQAYIFYGAADCSGFNSITANEANVTFNGTSPGYLGAGVATGDINNDSIIDLVISAPSINLSGGALDNTGQVYIFYGSSGCGT